MHLEINSSLIVAINFDQLNQIKSYFPFQISIFFIMCGNWITIFTLFRKLLKEMEASLD